MVDGPIFHDVMEVHLADNVRGRRLESDGGYTRLKPQGEDSVIDSQQWMLEHRKAWHDEE